MISLQAASNLLSTLHATVPSTLFSPCRAVSELILKGYVFRKGQIKVSVFKLLQVCHMISEMTSKTMYPQWTMPLPQPTEGGDADSAQPFSPHHLVELSAITPSSVDTTGSEVKAFAEQLKPYPFQTAVRTYWPRALWCRGA